MCPTFPNTSSQGEHVHTHATVYERQINNNRKQYKPDSTNEIHLFAQFSSPTIQSKASSVRPSLVHRTAFINQIQREHPAGDQQSPVGSWRIKYPKEINSQRSTFPC